MTDIERLADALRLAYEQTQFPGVKKHIPWEHIEDRMQKTWIAVAHAARDHFNELTRG